MVAIYTRVASDVLPVSAHGGFGLELICPQVDAFRLFLGVLLSIWESKCSFLERPLRNCLTGTNRVLKREALLRRVSQESLREGVPRLACLITRFGLPSGVREAR